MNKLSNKELQHVKGGFGFFHTDFVKGEKQYKKYGTRYY
mgnify:CR=1 FL=1